MSENEQRKALNEAVFREVNEKIEELEHRFAIAENQSLDIVCECDHIECAEPLSVDLEIYEKVRSEPTLFLLLPGHQDSSVEDVVDAGDNYLIVRKRPGVPREIAEQTDPRSA